MNVVPYNAGDSFRPQLRGPSRSDFQCIAVCQLWLELVPMELLWFHQIDLSDKAKDEAVWRLCQERGYLLLTGNRTADDGTESLEMSVRQLVNPDSLPVLTIGNLKRVNADPAYCKACAERLAEIVDELHKYRGITRLYLP